MQKFIGLLIILLIPVALVAQAQEVKVITFQDFDEPTLPTGNGWGFGALSGGKVSISTDRDENFGGSAGSLKGSYPVASGGMYVWGGYDISHLNTNEVFIEFWAKMPSTKKQGLKFLKIFGQRTGPNNNQYANTTFGLDYSSGSMTQVSFGDGSTPGNDTQNVINLDGTYPEWIGRSYGIAKVLTPKNSIWAASKWGDGWHHFKIHVKFNSGTTAENEKPDGAYFVSINGETYVDAKGLYNRHYSNAPIEKISFFDWSQSGSSAFEIWYDDIRITTGGFYSNAPLPPGKPTVRQQ